MGRIPIARKGSKVEMRKDGRIDAILGWCSGKTVFITAERRKFRRVHGLQLPLHPQQVIGWIVIVLIVINTFTVLTPLLGSNVRFVFSVVISIIFFAHLSSHLIVLLLDPADPGVRAQATNKVLPEFDRTKHSHVIENGRCHICNISTGSKRTKHCSICNKCVIRFDHHCKWLNNCIGARNYLPFLLCLISAILSTVFVAALSASELLFSLFAERIERVNSTTADSTDCAQPISDIGSTVVISAIAILSTIAALLLIHLCCFHGYIAYLGLTTYEYVRRKRDEKAMTAVNSLAGSSGEKKGRQVVVKSKIGETVWHSSCTLFSPASLRNGVSVYPRCYRHRKLDTVTHCKVDDFFFCFSSTPESSRNETWTEYSLRTPTSREQLPTVCQFGTEDQDFNRVSVIVHSVEHCRNVSVNVNGTDRSENRSELLPSNGEIAQTIEKCFRLHLRNSGIWTEKTEREDRKDSKDDRTARIDRPRGGCSSAPASISHSGFSVQKELTKKLIADRCLTLRTPFPKRLRFESQPHVTQSTRLSPIFEVEPSSPRSFSPRFFISAERSLPPLAI